jgi:signal transduction histidine kinase
MKPIQRSLVWKLTLAFVLVAITSAALVAVFIRLTSSDRLGQLVVDQQRSSLQASLASYYTTNGSWNNLSVQWQQLLTQSSSPSGNPAGNDNNPSNIKSGYPPPDFQGRPPNRGGNFALVDDSGKVIAGSGPDFTTGAQVKADLLKAGVPISVNGKQVGVIVTVQRQPGFNGPENLFLQRTNQALLWAGAGALLVGIVMGILLARTLVRPLQALTVAARKIEGGDLEQQVVFKSEDEIGQLASAFNRMSQEVSRVNQQRRQMTADIAHDLRTPLTVIAGYVESMRDGVLQPTFERYSIMYTEIEHLQNLVGDLRMLSQVDAGELPLHRQAIGVKGMLERAIAPFEHHAEQEGVTLAVEAEEGLPDLQVDEARMAQVFSNLLSNALCYTSQGGKITLTASRTDKKVELSVRDTGAGIAPEEIPLIFDRFHRADKSRHSEGGESGLGLAIVKALVEAHGGSVRAESTLGVGTAIILTLPV